MSKEERNTKVIAFKKNGLSYKQISHELGIPVGTVKSILSRVTEEDGCSCKNCGKPITSIKGKKEKVFCSDTCRLTWWNNHRDKGNKVIYRKICPACGTQFETINANKKYCTHECYITFRYGKAGDSNE